MRNGGVVLGRCAHTQEAGCCHCYQMYASPGVLLAQPIYNPLDDQGQRPPLPQAAVETSPHNTTLPPSQPADQRIAYQPQLLPVPHIPEANAPPVVRSQVSNDLPGATALYLFVFICIYLDPRLNYAPASNVVPGAAANIIEHFLCVLSRPNS